MLKLILRRATRAWLFALAFLIAPGTPGFAQFSAPAMVQPVTTGVWNHLGAVIAPTTALEIGTGIPNAQEVSIIGPEAGCTLVPTQYTTCFKAFYTTGTTPVIGYAESPDGIHNWVKSPTAVLSGYRSTFATVNAATFTASSSGTTLTVTGAPTGQIIPGMFLGAGFSAGTYITARGTGTGGAGTYTISASQTVGSTTVNAKAYYILASLGLWSQIDLYTSATGQPGTFTAFKTNFIPKGAGGSWRAAAVTNTSMIWQSGTAYIFLEGYLDGAGGTGGIGLFTSTDMQTVTEPVSNPVASSAGGNGAMGSSYYGGPTVPIQVGNAWFMLIHTKAAGGAGSEISMISAPSLTSTAWTASPFNPVFTRLTAAEGGGTANGQAVDPFWLIVNNRVWLYYSASSDINISTGQFAIKLAIADVPIAQLVAGVQGSNYGTLAVNDNLPATNVITFTGAGTYNWVPPFGTKFFQVIVRGQGGCGGGGASLSGGQSGSGGAGGGGAIEKRFDWMPVSAISGAATIQIGTPCTAAAAGVAGAKGGQAFFGATGMDGNAIAYVGGGGAAGSLSTASGGGGGAGSIGDGSNASGATGGGGGNMTGVSGGSGSGPSNNSNIQGGGGGGGSSSVGVASTNAQSIDGATGGAAGGGCNAGTPQAGGAAVSAFNGISLAGGAAGGTTGGAGQTGPPAAARGGAGGSGGGGGTAQGGVGGNGGPGGGGGGGGGSGCGGTGGAGGVGGAAEVKIYAN